MSKSDLSPQQCVQTLSVYLVCYDMWRFLVLFQLVAVKHVCLYFQAFDDRRTLSNILLQLAVMALAESNWGQATSLLLEAQVWP